MSLPTPPRITKTKEEGVKQAWSQLVQALTQTVPTLVSHIAYTIDRTRK